MPNSGKTEAAGLSSGQSSSTAWTVLAKGLLLALILGGGLQLRLQPMDDIVREEAIYLGGTDPLYHVRRIILTVRNYPHVPQFDYYVNFPHGARIQVGSSVGRQGP